jgi:fermentation-respiration switch protein FrsA (DUF1100 family)
VLVIAGMAYVTVGFLGQATARSMLFFSMAPSYWIAGDFVRLPTEDGAQIAALYLPNPAARFTMLYLHGNASELGRDRPFLEEVRAHGFAVLAIDYHGYGCSGGSPSERALYADARAALKYLDDVRHVPPEHVIVYGFSLGGGPAVDLAAHERVAGLILQSTFASAFAVETVLGAALFAPFDLFRNRAKIARIGCPLLLFHGTYDRVVPFANAERLYAGAREPKRAVWVEGAGHNNLRQSLGERYWEALGDFSRGLRHPDPVESH